MPVISRRTPTGIQVFDEAVEPLRTFPLPPDVWDWVVPSTRDSVVYSTDDAVLRTDAGGREQWRFELGPVGENDGIGMNNSAFSADETLVWVYVANAMADRADLDELIALDAATGAVRTRIPVESAGQGAGLIPLPDGQVLVSIGEGQDGGVVLRAGPDGELHDYLIHDRVVIDASPDRRQFLTVDHERRADMALHDLATGEVVHRIPAAGFGLGDRAYVNWSGGYLDDETVIVVIVVGEPEHTWRHFRVDTRTGEVLGDLGIVTVDKDDLEPLGDGTYVISDTDGTLRRM
ncbi:hypothetical protein [Actinoplanes sp. L3-i22]|uniref:hypothetical protein n=1 Tax=Actinoplanes sp. L3-i22 TaxID=2836373 RepID=UPI001C7740A9|nr:hypothetical protein [Actinoplanes sp. L3-i22]BCY05336.1 hypothetical protein L3i22_004240 [Actinoplanes sp. L3-i22]